MNAAVAIAAATTIPIRRMSISSIRSIHPAASDLLSRYHHRARDFYVHAGRIMDERLALGRERLANLDLDFRMRGTHRHDAVSLTRILDRRAIPVQPHLRPLVRQSKTGPGADYGGQALGIER